MIQSDTNAEQGDAGDISPEDRLRAQFYRLLARYLAKVPTRADLDSAAALKGDDSPLGEAINAFAKISAQMDEASADDEYHDLFIGVARGELLPFGSYYLSGFFK